MGVRTYKGTSVQMLLAVRLIAENALGMVDKMKAIRAKWDAPYYQNLIKEIDTILKDDFAIDPSFLLKEKTEQLKASEADAKSALQLVKTQVEIEFRKEPEKCSRILSTLGLNFVAKIGKASQAQLIEMLVCFEKNLTPSLREELAAVGINELILEKVCCFSDSFYSLNTEQEVLKVGKREVSSVLSDKLDGVYDEVINMSKLACTLLTNPIDIDKLTYIKALRQIGYKEGKSVKSASDKNS